MPHLDHTGPEGSGTKTGRKLGECKNSETEQSQKDELGLGQGLRRNSGGGEGKKKRLQYNNKV